MLFLHGYGATQDFDIPSWCALRPETCMQDYVAPQLSAYVTRQVGGAIDAWKPSLMRDATRELEATLQKEGAVLSVEAERRLTTRMLGLGAVILGAAWWLGARRRG